MSIKIVNNVVDSNTLQTIYASRLQAMFGKFARSVTLEPTTVRIQFNKAMYSDAPAWSDDSGLTVVHHPEQGSVLSVNNLTRLKGLVIHELSHLMFTPRSRTALPKWVSEHSYGNAFNLLEDNRIENFTVSRMSGVKPWLVHTVTTELLKDNPDTSKLLPLVWGRKYLPQSVRTAALKAWGVAEGDASAKEVARIIDKYILLTLHDKEEVLAAQELIAALHALLNASGNDPISAPNHSVSNPNVSSAPASDGSKPLGKREVAEAKQDVAKQVANQEDPEEYESGEATRSETTSEVTDALKEARDSARAAVTEDVKATIETVKSPTSSASFTDDEFNSKSGRKEIKPVSKYWLASEVVSPEARAMSQLFARELVQIRSDFDPGWVRKSDQGKLNVRDYMLGTSFDEAFDLWDHGLEEATDIECVILLDNSGSMEEMITPAYEAMWATKRAFDTIDASTTVIQYASWGNYLYQSHEKATVKMTTARREGGGSTLPYSSLVKANEILQSSARAIKMMIMITDGDWGNSKVCDQIIATMRNSGIVTGLVFLQSAQTPFWTIKKDEAGAQLIDAHCCEAAVVLTEPRGIVQFAKQLAKVSRERLLAR